MKRMKLKKKMNVWMYLAIGYFAVVVAGSILLILPFASTTGSTYYIDALFTSFSAACVTGLVTVTTATHWTLYGKIVILLLIQLGGLGFMTFISILLIAIKRNLGQYERRAVLQAVGGDDLSGVKKLVRRIVFGTLVFELIGAGLLCIRFIPAYGVSNGIWYSVFHAVSAFCNAGFDILGEVSFAGYATDPLVSLTLCGLIIIGGIGFCIWGDVFECKFNFKKYQFYTKVIIIVNTGLLFVSTWLFLLFERNNPSYAGYNFGQKLLCSFFNATTARTAGFFTTDPATLSGSGSLLMIMLMFIGGSSGSTAGGIKVGTITVIVMGMISAFRGKRDINMGKRRIDMQLVGRALAIFAAYLFLILTATVIICAIEPNTANSFQRALFESTSALGTVGLSMAFTGSISWGTKIVLMLLMYMGRAGVFTLAYALSRKRETPQVRRPADSFFIG